MNKSHRPKLGQHFLADTHYCSRIADVLELRPDDLVVEVGPGHGAMTGLLSSRARDVVAIEIDSQLADELRQKLQHASNVEIMHSDVLLTDIGGICSRHGVDLCYVFGNLPYYITSPIIHHMFEFASQIRAMGLLVQREVADRLVAKPGSRDYGYLTVFTRLYASARVAFQIPPGAFSPPPKVHSAFVRFEMCGSGQRMGREDEQKFLRFLKQSFAHKRKKLLNCLSAKYPRQKIEAEIERLGLPLGVRAEQLSLDQFLAIFSSLR